MDNIQLPENWRDWELKELIGSGSFSRVYRAERNTADKVFASAIKIIPIPVDDREAESARLEFTSDEALASYYEGVATHFFNEIALMDRLKGITNIVSIEDYAIMPKGDGIGWIIYIRMELLESLPTYLKRHSLTEDDIIRIGTDISTALDYCQSLDILHRDIKPANIFISQYGNFKLGDFGVARQMAKTVSGYTVTGTFDYIAPEVYRSAHYDATADLYSLGMVLYKLLNNNRGPFVDPHRKEISYSDKEAALARRMRGEPFPRPANGSDDLCQVVLTACAYRPETRFQSAKAMKTALLGCRGSRSTKTSYRPDSGKYTETSSETSRETFSSGHSQNRKTDETKKIVLAAIAIAACAAALLVLFNALSGTGSLKSASGDAAGSSAETSVSASGEETANSETDVSSDSVSASSGASSVSFDASSASSTVISSDAAEETVLDDVNKPGEHVFANTGLENHVIEFNDPVLEDAIRKALYITDDAEEVTLEDLFQIRELKITASTELSDLSVLQECYNLQTLDLNHDSALTDLSPLSGLANLYDLNINHCGVTSLAPLAGLPSLKKLNANSCNVSDLNDLVGSVSLEEIFLRDNNFTDISPLKRIPSLMHTELSENAIEDFTVLKDLPNLQIVVLAKCGMTDEEFRTLASLLAANGKVTMLDISKNDITDFSPLGALTTMEELHLEYCAINDSNLQDVVNALSNMPNLQTLYLRLTDISTVEPLTVLTALTYLDISNTDVADLTPLIEMPALEKVACDKIPADKSVLDGTGKDVVPSKTYNHLS